MTEMGIFRTTIGIESTSQRGQIEELADTLVDTGSQFTWIPRSVLESLGIKPKRRQGFIMADGTKIERDIGYAIVHAGGVATADVVVFGEVGLGGELRPSTRYDLRASEARRLGFQRLLGPGPGSGRGRLIATRLSEAIDLALGAAKASSAKSHP